MVPPIQAVASGRTEHSARTRVVDIRSHGAVGDGRTMNTRAIQNAIDACARSGGGMIAVPAGVFDEIYKHAVFLLPKAPR